MWIQFFGQDFFRTVTEIVILWGIFYVILKSVRGTRAMHVIQFTALLVLLTYVSRLLELMTLHWLLTSAQLPIFVALVLLYAPELRRSVTSLGHFAWLYKKKNKEDPNVTEVAQAVQSLSRRHIGALIVFERNGSLQGFIDTGIRMDSDISAELLVSIFSPLTPLHDGAVIIREGRVAAASCLLPLSDRDEAESGYGTRHLAALGLAEETDCLVVVVSEETGKISLALNGRLTRHIEPDKFESILLNVLSKGVGVKI